MNEILLAHYYNGFTTTNMLESDIKTLKKINSCYAKYMKSEKVGHLLEVMNILNIMKNVMDIDQGKYSILRFIDDEYKGKVDLLIDNLDMINKKYIKDNEDLL